mgnify:CR=1 FL=1
MKKKSINLLCFVISLMISILIMIFGNFSNFTQTTYINESVTLIDEVPIVNLNIADIKGCHFITKANYIPNEFVRTKDLKKSEIIDIKEIDGKIVYILKGISIRIIADSPEDDLLMMKQKN